MIQVDIQSQVPIYEQIKSQIIKKIIDGELKDGVQVPSVRQLAADLGINLHTVNKSYKILENEGWIMINKKKGTFINPDIERIKLQYKEEALLEAIDPLLMIYRYVDGDTDKLKQLIRKYL
ncbi:hypothetical protein SH2C18_27680 [Clostridium sediminicola]|uniref:GntR family transcriptional regulator n=1 Tax=Clostridium sediminicola TaxID=3114879 RepID=UPI0031F1CF18